MAGGLSDGPAAPAPAPAPAGGQAATASSTTATAAETRFKITAGRAWPLGAHWDGSGVNFAVFSAHAEAIDLCLFDDAGHCQTACLRLPGRDGDIWHGRIDGAAPGLVYGLRAEGPWRPEQGHRFDHDKLLLDPYAREIVGRFEWGPSHFSADRSRSAEITPHDNAAAALKARVVHDGYDWQGDEPPGTALADSVLYELHVKGFSKLNPPVPEALRGTYAGLAHPASIAHLRALGVTAVSLLPVHHSIAEQRLAAMGLTNYWGYNTIGFFSPDPRLAAADGGQALRSEFRDMVRALHAAGLEVILDVVFNHTAESDELGPTISMRGLDNACYYRLPPESPQLYVNDTGCGNTVDARTPRVVQLVLDSLRYWVEAMHVDGFRFDLAPVLGRTDAGFDRRAPFFIALAQDPVLARVKLIAEPWDIGPGGYQVGGFPAGWGEWNDRFRDDMRSFWLRHPSTRAAFARRLCGSSDLFETRGRAPAESINYVVSHDGFTLHDLLTYSTKRNQANGEANRDGTSSNLGFNGGAEGETDDAEVNARRATLKRALLAVTLLAQGTPMLCAGDELGHSQAGNNNPYCQDGPLTWIDWQRADADLTIFTARVLALRRTALPFRNRWYSGLADASGGRDVAWLQPDGSVLEGDAWQDRDARTLGCLIGEPGRANAPLLLLVNAGDTATDFTLPAGAWDLVLDTHHVHGLGDWHGPGQTRLAVPAGTLLLLAAAGAGIALAP